MAEYLKIAFSDIEKIELIGGTKAQTLKQAVAGYSRKPDYVFNACHFDNGQKSSTYGITISDTIVDGKCINTNPDEKAVSWKYNGIYEPRGIAFNDDGKMKLCSTATAVEEKWTSFIGGSPVLSENYISNTKGLKTGFAKQKTYRIGMGFNKNELIVGFPDDKMTLTELTGFMNKHGAFSSIALDGGGSVNVQKLKGSSYVHVDNLNQNRPVSTFVCIWLKRDEPKQTEPTVVKNETVVEAPTWNGKKAIGVVEVTWDSVNRRAGAGTNYAMAGAALKKGDRITVFDQKGTWVQSYGYWISKNATKWVKRY